MGRITIFGSVNHLCSWLILAAVPALLTMGSPITPTEKVDPAFLGSLRESNGKADIVVLFAAGTREALESVNSQKFATREERLVAVNTALTENAKTSQAAVQEFLRSKDPEPTWESKWINNSIFIRKANAELIDELVNFAEISEIREDKIVAKILLDSEQSGQQQQQ